MNMMTDSGRATDGARAAREDAHRRRARRRRRARSRCATPTPARVVGTRAEGARSTTCAAPSRSRAPTSRSSPATSASRSCTATAELIRRRAEAISDLITAESGSARRTRSTRSAAPATSSRSPATRRCSDDGQIFSCDLTPHGKSRKVYTLREPLLGAISAITPFNHPLNQVAHKVAPAIATNNRMVLKPTEKTPLTALLLADMLYEAGLPPRDAVGRHRRSARDRRRDDHQPATSTSSPSPAASPVGKYIAAKAGYKRQVLELGGNDPLIVMEDADLDKAADAGRGGLLQELGPALHGGQAHPGARAASPTRSSSACVAKTRGLDVRRPDGSERRHGHRDRRGAATQFERRVNDAVAQGAKLLAGNDRQRRALCADGARPRRPRR